jgi:anti-sigma factor RsiW
VTASRPVSHGRAFELLPWLVNGTLSDDEREAVAEHARTCIACRRELKEQQRLYAAMRAHGAADVYAEAGLEGLERELDGEARRWRVGYVTAARFAVAAAAGLAVLVVLVWLTPLPRVADASYSTLAAPGATGTALIDVVFAEETTSAQMQELLDDIGGEIVAGPTNLGRYTVCVRAPKNEAQRAELLRSLGADPRVRFAGPSFAEVPP